MAPMWLEERYEEATVLDPLSGRLDTNQAISFFDITKLRPHVRGSTPATRLRTP
jgi:hypothetical protein